MVVVLAVLRDTDPFQYWKEACLDEKEAQVVFVMVQFCSIGNQLRLLFIHEAEGVFCSENSGSASSFLGAPFSAKLLFGP